MTNEYPPSTSPLSLEGRGAGGEGARGEGRLPIPPALEPRMIELAREFRKDPTPSEATLWRLIRGKQLGARFRRQQPIGPFVVDFFCPEYRVIVEVDGPIHEAQTERDRERQHLLEAGGFRVLRLPAAEVEGYPQAALQHIRAFITGPSNQGPHPPPIPLSPAERGDIDAKEIDMERPPSPSQS